MQLHTSQNGPIPFVLRISADFGTKARLSVVFLYETDGAVKDLYLALKVIFLHQDSALKDH